MDEKKTIESIHTVDGIPQNQDNQEKGADKGDSEATFKSLTEDMAGKMDDLLSEEPRETSLTDGLRNQLINDFTREIDDIDDAKEEEATQKPSLLDNVEKTFSPLSEESRETSQTDGLRNQLIEDFTRELDDIDDTEAQKPSLVIAAEKTESLLSEELRETSLTDGLRNQLIDGLTDGLEDMEGSEEKGAVKGDSETTNKQSPEDKAANIDSLLSETSLTDGLRSQLIEDLTCESEDVDDSKVTEDSKPKEEPLENTQEQNEKGAAMKDEEMRFVEDVGSAKQEDQGLRLRAGKSGDGTKDKNADDEAHDTGKVENEEEASTQSEAGAEEVKENMNEPAPELNEIMAALSTSLKSPVVCALVVFALLVFVVLLRCLFSLNAVCYTLLYYSVLIIFGYPLILCMVKWRLNKTVIMSVTGIFCISFSILFYRCRPTITWLTEISEFLK